MNDRLLTDGDLGDFEIEVTTNKKAMVSSINQLLRLQDAKSIKANNKEWVEWLSERRMFWCPCCRAHGGSDGDLGHYELIRILSGDWGVLRGNK